MGGAWWGRLLEDILVILAISCLRPRAGRSVWSSGLMMSPVEVRHLQCIVSLLLPVCSPVSHLVWFAWGRKQQGHTCPRILDGRLEFFGFFSLAQQQKRLYRPVLDAVRPVCCPVCLIKPTHTETIVHYVLVKEAQGDQNVQKVQVPELQLDVL